MHSPILIQIVGIFLDKRPNGGRFFIDKIGAYWKDKDKTRQTFVEWIPEEELTIEVQPLSRSELLAMIRKNKG
jgi:hypothetical protein